MLKLIFECYEIFILRCYLIWCVVFVGEENNCEFYDFYVYRLYIFGGGDENVYNF